MAKGVDIFEYEMCQKLKTLYQEQHSLKKDLQLSVLVNETYVSFAYTIWDARGQTK